MTYYPYYVYTLAYPDGRIFYVGKGQGDRILQHEKEARQYYNPQRKESAKVRAIREIWASGGQVVKTKVFQTENEEEAYEYEKQFIAQCDSHFLTNRTKGGGPQFSKQDPYARLKHREYYYSPKEAFEKLGVSQQVWHRLFLSGVLHFYQSEGCTLPVLDRKEIDDFAARIKDGSYPIDVWEMADPNVWKTKTPEKKSPWWDDEPSSQQGEEQYPMSRLEMLREATTTVLNAAQQAFSETCHLIGSYELRQPEQSEPTWKIAIRVGQQEYTYLVRLQQNHFVISNAPTKLPAQEEARALSEWNEPCDDEDFPSVDQTLPEYPVSEQPDISAVSQPAGKSVMTTGVPRLTIAEVKVQWEAVLRRIKSKKDGAKVAAILRGYGIVGVDDRADLPIVILKARFLFHYRTIRDGGHLPLIEWALKVELKQECRLRLLPPEAPIP
jgi:hypothetical protein